MLIPFLECYTVWTWTMWATYRRYTCCRNPQGRNEGRWVSLYIENPVSEKKGGGWGLVPCLGPQGQ
jgi:hypothetical protein